MEFYFRRLFFVSTFAPSTGNNNLIDGAILRLRLEKRLRLSKAQASLVLHSACALFENLVQRYLGNENRFPTLIKTFIRFHCSVFVKLLDIIMIIGAVSGLPGPALSR